MIEFWIIALLLVAFAVMAAIWPLVKGKVDAPGEGISDEGANVAHFRDQQSELERQVELGSLSSDEGECLSRELEKKLVEELGQSPAQPGRYFRTRSAAFALVVALVIPMIAVPLYIKLGSQTEMEVVDAMMRSDLQPGEVQSLLERWVARRPGNNQALFMLGGHYMRTGQMDKAVATYRDLVRITNGHPRVVAELAQVLFLKEQNQVTGEVRRFYQNALDQDPQNITALGLKGIDAFDQADYSGAIAAWQQALNHEADPSARQSLSTGIIKARNLLGQPVVQIRVMVDLAPELAKLPRDARV
ncbi:MAG: c-type cytochrome biogenesis protein CcmI, partial [Endozoicomonas sp.]